MGNRIVVSDSQDSFHFVRYKRTENQLIVFADDTNQRWITSACLLDYDTIAGADKFGNISVVRLYCCVVNTHCKDLMLPVLKADNNIAISMDKGLFDQDIK